MPFVTVFDHLLSGILRAILLSLTVSFVLNCSFAQIPEYYSSVNFDLSGMALKEELAEKISTGITFLTYTTSSYNTWDALQDGDENPENTNEVLLFYGWENGSDGIVQNDRTRSKSQYGGNPGEWNREHVFARSLASPPLTVDDPGPGTDILNLRACDMQTNQNRSNLSFTDGSGNAAQIGSAWYPGDEWKGDVARIILYMYLRYDGNGSALSQTLCLPSSTGTGPSVETDPNVPLIFLEWNAEDPVSEMEIEKNQVAEIHQGNRNPFVDNPALANLIWGGPEAEDTWGLTDNAHDFSPSTEVYANGVLLSWEAPAGSVACQIRGGILGGNDPKSINIINENPEFIFVTDSQLGAGGDFQWRVRCATSVNPVQGLSEYSDYDTFTFPGESFILTPSSFPIVPDNNVKWDY